MLRKAEWDIERRILIGMYYSMGPYEWATYRRAAISRVRTKTLTLPPRLDLAVI